MFSIDFISLHAPVPRTCVFIPGGIKVTLLLYLNQRASKKRACARSRACNHNFHRVTLQQPPSHSRRLRTPSARITGVHNRYRHTEMPYNTSY